MVNMIESHLLLTRLKRRIAALAPPAGTGRARRVSFGIAALDTRLEGGLARGAVHEVVPESGADIASASAFALMMAARAAEVERPILWIMRDARAFAPSRSGLCMWRMSVPP